MAHGRPRHAFLEGPVVLLQIKGPALRCASQIADLRFCPSQHRANRRCSYLPSPLKLRLTGFVGFFPEGLYRPRLPQERAPFQPVFGLSPVEAGVIAFQ